MNHMVSTGEIPADQDHLEIEREMHWQAKRREILYKLRKLSKDQLKEIIDELATDVLPPVGQVE